MVLMKLQSFVVAQLKTKLNTAVLIKIDLDSKNSMIFLINLTRIKQ